jgi:hypothetical protein
MMIATPQKPIENNAYTIRMSAVTRTYWNNASMKESTHGVGNSFLETTYDSSRLPHTVLLLCIKSQAII